ncbi:hypothetical protein [Brevibacillus agri]|uniref:hypothetical protein n=1 Tax=Brevibacillus agri TaxID=51101 RepID=UPI0030F3F6BA
MSLEETCKTVLAEMKQLILEGKKHFVRRNRQGKNYLQQFLDMNLTSIDAAWECIVNDLNHTHYHSGPMHDHQDGPGSPLVVWVFKMEINGVIAYIKLKIETNGRGCVCLSFHEDEP